MVLRFFGICDLRHRGMILRMTLEEQIAALEQRLALMTKRVVVDGVDTTFDDAEDARRRLAELKRRQAVQQGRGGNLSYIDLSGF